MGHFLSKKFLLYFVILFALVSFIILFSKVTYKNQKEHNLYTKKIRNQTPVFRLINLNQFLLTFEDIETHKIKKMRKYSRILSKNNDIDVIAITHPSKRNIREKCYRAKIDHIHWTLRAYNQSSEIHPISKLKKCNFVLDSIAFLIKREAFSKLFNYKYINYSPKNDTYYIDNISLIGFQLLLLSNEIPIYVADEVISMPKYHAMITESKLLSIFEQNNIKRVIYPNGTAELWGCMKTHNACCKVSNPLYPKGCRRVNQKNEWIKTPPCWYVNII